MRSDFIGQCANLPRSGRTDQTQPILIPRDEPGRARSRHRDRRKPSAEPFRMPSSASCSMIRRSAGSTPGASARASTHVGGMARADRC
jgi:hypothetical protein